ncbi:membrane-associated HD superfamily phosphohydrolase [Chryseobacterium defluvii]|uniref:Membrane-associated HD superfamily phosphohydrolase n=1 Tax=Chryseobacterium defluvii TaxID=160396 RepID=A0A840KN61_9FLAO|nr:hypothetical protein [Chryseobacterium defluvii]MBB4808272.1 membrane-associated HD superfamily phosphohydrolase [Chryseobacterium defluvii]
MKLTPKNPLVMMLLSLMAGMFITISFLETPMKFQVQGMTLPIALKLGKLMFGISTRIQAVLLILILICMLLRKKSYTKLDFVLIIVFFLILIVENFWMLPVLNVRVDLLSNGKPIPPSELHNYFIYAESAKAVILILSIILQFKTKKNGYWVY